MSSCKKQGVLRYRVTVERAFEAPERFVWHSASPTIALGWVRGTRIKIHQAVPRLHLESVQGAIGSAKERRTHRRKLPQPNTGFLEDPCGLEVHGISLTVDDLGDADLGDLDAAGEARAGVAVEDRSFTDPLAPGFEERVLFGVDAKACREGQTGALTGVAA